MNRLIQWFIDNPVAANLLMVVIIIGGIFSLPNMNKEVFPGVETNVIQVSVPYPGAGPSEVEEQIVQRVEEAVADLDGIEEIRSTARLGRASINIEAVNGFDAQRLLNDVKGRVDAIPTLPVDAERPIVTQALWRHEVISIGLYGDVDERALKVAGDKMRDELSLIKEISMVELQAVRDEEMSIELSEEALRHYNLSFEQVVGAIRGSSLNLPAGTIKTDTGDIQVQTRGQAYSANDFERIVVESRPDGSKLYVGDIAEVTDGFSDFELISRLNGKRAIYLELYITENPDVLSAAAAVRDYLDKVTPQLPQGIMVSVPRDMSVLFTGRMNLLLKNSFSGLLLVFVVLMLFLRPALAMWVCLGIVIAFMGTFWLLPYFGVSLNMVSLFAFLLVLGIVVDDAIIVGESVYSEQHKNVQGAVAAARGTKSISKPVLFAVISTMIFFAPMLSIPGGMGDMMYSIPVIVILALFFSLVESLLILPSHLSHMKPENPNPRFKFLGVLERWREKLADGMLHFSDSVYRPNLKKLLTHNGATIAFFAVAFGLSVATYMGGWLPKGFMPVVPSDFIRMSIVLPEGEAFQKVERVLLKVEATVEELKQDEDLLLANNQKPFVTYSQNWAYGTNIWLTLGLEPGENRDVAAPEVARRWRELIGPLPEAESLDISSTINKRGKGIRLRLTAADSEQMDAALQELKGVLARYPGVYDIKDSHTGARTEIELDLKAQAESLGLSLNEIARQVRQAFYGAEVQRIPRGNEDVKVMVRYPKAERRSLETLDDMRIRTADKREIALEAVADIEFVPGYTKIDRIDRKRSITVTADVLKGTSSPGAIVSEIMRKNMPEWKERYPGFKVSLDGDMKEESDFLSTAAKNFALALLVIYGLMSVAFRSYWQPMLILTAIPFGFMGAIIGHVIMGREVSMMSMLGFFACAGVVVNDNLVLLDRINTLREQGKDVLTAVLDAGRDRFRPIILTSLTTFIGLVPILAETSTQAKFLIPMVISLSFGVLFATVVTLVLVPSLYYIGERIRAKISGRPMLLASD